MQLFKSKRPQYEHLRKKWVAKHKNITDRLVNTHLKQVALGSLGGLLLLPSTGLTLNPQALTSGGSIIHSSKDDNKLLAAELKDKLPNDVKKLDTTQEKTVTDLLSKRFGFTVTASLDNKMLNTDYGLIGGEQHLYRYPGDTLYEHAQNSRDWAMFGGAGVAPGLGAWGYFAPSKEQMTSLDVQRERWYIAVQTFLSPGFAEKTAEYRDFYKYRKMLLVNPATGQAVVTDIADAGPSEYTGKSLGGSPEVMDALGLGSGPRKGAVLYFFIDDANNEIPLGPATVKDDSSLAGTAQGGQS